MARVTVFYWDLDKTDRDDRWEASMGNFIGSDKFKRVASFETDNSDPKAAAEDAFELFNIGDRCGKRVRSMSCGDVAVVEAGDEETTLICKPVGFEELEGFEAPA